MKKLIALILGFQFVATYAQHITPEMIKACPRIENMVQFYPLTRDTLDIFPEQMYFVGEIVEVSGAPLCGFVCTSGTIKVQLVPPIKNYPNNYAFIALPCFAGTEEEYLHKVIHIDASRLSFDNRDCYWNELPVNRIDSGEIPFYIPSDLDIELIISE